MTGVIIKNFQRNKAFMLLRIMLKNSQERTHYLSDVLEIEHGCFFALTHIPFLRCSFLALGRKKNIELST